MTPPQVPRGDRESAAAVTGAAAPLPPDSELYRLLFESAPDAMLLVDEAGRIAQANLRAESLFGYAPGELLGAPVEDLIPSRFATVHAAHRTRYLAAPVTRAMGSRPEVAGRRKDGGEIDVDVLLAPLESSAGTFVLCSLRDAGERQRIERQRLESLREKEAMLREIHHREKNNLAIISSLLYLQANQTEDEAAIRLFEECRQRVHSIALVHESLYRSESFAAVNFAEYARTLADQLLRNQGARERGIRLETDLEEVRMSIDRAVPCGLLLNELLSNALRHAFPPGRGGVVSVGWRSDEDRLRFLEVSDDGIGLPAGFDPRNCRTLGMTLVRSLSRQVDGRFELVDRHPGTTARLTFRGRDDTA